MLQDDVLLDIFDFYRNNHYNHLPFHPRPRPVWEWRLLLHVCRIWRQIIFESSRRLNLQTLCTHGTPVRKSLGIWPVFPIVLDLFSLELELLTPIDEDNAIAALQHPDRVCSVTLYVSGSQSRKIATVMQEPFPVLKCLKIYSKDKDAPVLPVEFLGGSAPRTQKLDLSNLPYPTLPSLLLSASDLVSFDVRGIP